jgi:hypothetical protein
VTRRVRLLVRYAAVSAGVVVLAWGLAAVATSRRDAPVVPGDLTVAGLTDDLRRRPPDDAPRVEFVEAAAASGIDCDNFQAVRSRVLPEDMASGCAWFDLEGDGDLDLFVVRMEPIDASKGAPGRRSGHALFRNEGGGRFTDGTRAAGVGLPVHGLGVAPADYDGDGDVDLYVTCFGKNQLFRNDGGGRFTDVASEAGVAVESFSTGAAWADYDQDGDLDLYVAGYVRYVDDPSARGRASRQGAFDVPYAMNPSSWPPAGGHLFRNRGDGRFDDVTAEAGVSNEKGRGLSVIFTDLDGDLLPDLYVANDVSDNVYYWNRGGGRFQDVSHSSCTADHRGAMGLAVGDYDGDGDFDFFITHWIAQENALYERVPTRGDDGLGPLYMDVADRRGVGAIALDFVGWGCAFLDYDLDGRLDLFMTNGHTLDSGTPRLEPQRPLLFWNAGARGFFDVADRSGAAVSECVSGRGAAFGDYDGDGDEDVCVVVHGGPLRLYRNDQRTGHGHLTVRVRQGGMNRFAMGAKVALTAAGATQVRLVGAQPSYLSGNALDLCFGLGEAARADRIEVVFPDGARAVRTGVPAGGVVVIEPDARPRK